jgi:hypothetical protein
MAQSLLVGLVSIALIPTSVVKTITSLLWIKDILRYILI